MSPEENKSIVVRLLQAGTAFETVVNEVVSEDCEVTNVVSANRGRAAFLQSRDALEAAFADLDITVEDMIAENDKVVVQTMWNGTHRGTFLGVPRTGRAVRWAVVIVITVRNGQIVRWWSLVDRFAIVEQLSRDSTTGPGPQD